MAKINERYQKYIILLGTSIALRVLLYVITTFYGPRIAPLPCNTKDINYPFKKGTVPSIPLLIVTSVSTIIISLIIELYESNILKMDIKSKGKNPIFQKNMYFFAVFKIFVLYQIGYTIIFCLLRIFKYSIGKLRPNFVSICKPNFKNISCIDKYYSEYECMSSDKNAIDEARLSFFSGHAAYACYFSTFLIAYMFMRSSKSSKGTKFAYITTPIFIIFGICVSISRITDYKHHTLDVLVGLIVGIAVGISIAFSFEKTIRKDKDIFTYKER
uniref:AcidPPc domain-containing protein n=1 Tax=Strongyloides venezuelensis TaxID=75913 RepID=A0A0K0FBT4_STRVS